MRKHTRSKIQDPRPSQPVGQFWPVLASQPVLGFLGFLGILDLLWNRFHRFFVMSSTSDVK